MKVSLEREGKNVVRMGLELEPEKALKAYEMACRQLSHQVNIPGFRRGKAPRNIIEKTLGVEYIKREALESIVPELLNRAIVDENLDVITQPEIDECDFELGSPLKLRAKFEVRPEVTLGKYSGVSVEVPEAQIPEGSLERALNSIAENKASLQTIDPRPVKMGDTVLLDFECHVDGKLVEGGKAQGLILEVREGAFLNGFSEQLVDKTPGSDFEIKAPFPGDYRNPALAGKEAVFQVQLREIREKVIPDVNDELAKVVGHESLDALKEALQERFNEEIKQANDMRAQRAVVEKVVEGSNVDIPETMIERERDLLMQQMRRFFEQNNESWDAFEQSEDYESVKGSKWEEAKQRVLTSLVLGAVVRSESMTVDEDEMAPYLAEVVVRHNLPPEHVARNEDLKRMVMEEVLTNKVVEFLVSQAEVKYIPEEPHQHGPECDHDHEHEHGEEKPKAAAKAAKGAEKEKEGAAKKSKKKADE